MARAGQRNRRVTLQRARLVEGDLADAMTFDDVVTVWASFDPEKNPERIRAAQLVGVVGGRFRILQCEQVAWLSAQDQLVLHGRRGQPNRTFGIQEVNDAGAAELEIVGAAQADRRP